MKLYYTKFLIVLLIAFFISRTTSIYAQVKIGNHPTTINKASLLELESDSLGLLLPRLKDTITINSLNPPDGMVIYNIDAFSRQHFYIRRYGAWSEMGNSNEFLLKTGLKSDSVVTTLNGELRKLSFDSVVANSINNNSTLITNVINNASSFNLSNGLRTDSIVTTVNGALHKVSVDSLFNNDTLSLSNRINQRVNYSDSTIKYITPSQLHDSLVLIATGTNFPASTGDVKGPATNTDGYIALWKGINSKVLQNGVAIPAGGLAGLDALSALNITVNSKLARNVAITGATKTKITYDANGLVISGADATTADIITSSDKRYVTDSQLVVIQNTSGINTGNETQTTIKTKLGKASGSSDGYLTAVDWNIFNLKAPLGKASGNSDGYLTAIDWNMFYSKAPLASPYFTGTPTAPTPSPYNNTNQLATTAFVNSAITMISVPDATTSVKGKIKLAGDLTGTADIPKVVSVGGSTASNINSATIAANAATDLLKNNTIVKRDGTGNFSADTITATLNGNANNISGIVSVANGGTGINATTTPANYIFASPSSGTGLPTFRVLTVTDLPDLTGKYLPLTGGILTGTLKVNNSVTAVRYLATGVDLSPSGSSLTIDLTKGNVYNLTLKNTVTINVSNNTGSLPASYIFKLIYNISTPITITWPSAFKWSNGTIPTLTNVNGKTDILSIFFDGTNYYCSYALNF